VLLLLTGCADIPITVPPLLSDSPQGQSAFAVGFLTDREILVKIAETMSVDGANWLTDKPLETWAGVATDSLGRVTELVLDGSDEAYAQGTLPNEVGQLDELRVLKTSYVDSLPSTLAGANKLRTLSVRLSFYLDQVLPAELGELEYLDTLAILAGTVRALPPEVAGLPRLRYLRLAIDGEIPPEIGNAVALRYLNLHAAAGPIPSTIGNLTRLDTLAVSGVQGEVPPEIGNLTGLTFLDVSGTEGPLPSQMESMRGLRFLKVSGSFFPGFVTRMPLKVLRLYGVNGRIPETVGDMTDLRWLDLCCGIAGELPSALGRARELRTISVTGDLAGTLPEELGDLMELRSLWLENHPRLHGPIPESLTRLPHFWGLWAPGTNLCVPGRHAAWRRGLSSSWTRILRCMGFPGADFYLVQNVQSLESTAPLVAGEDAMLRVFYASPNASSSDMMPGVRLDVYSGGALVGTVTGEPGSRRIPRRYRGADMGELDNSVNVMVPGELVQPGIEVELTIDPADRLNLSRLGIPKVMDRVPVWVEQQMPLHLTLLPVIVEGHGDLDSSVVALVDSMAADPGHPLLAGLRVLPVYPLVVNKTEPVRVPFDGSLDRGKKQLQAVSLARTVRDGTGYWMGISRHSSPAGLAELGGWSSLSVPDAWTIAHELGHNLGLLHAPCGGPKQIDPGWRVGGDEWGIDWHGQVLVGVGDSWTYDQAPDVMSYCHRNDEPRKWITVYHFAKALEYRKQVEDAQPSGVEWPVIVDVFDIPGFPDTDLRPGKE